MPTIRVTKTVGRNLVEGRIVQLPMGTIRAISEEVGGPSWYQLDDVDARRRLARGEATTPKDSKKGKP